MTNKLKVTAEQKAALDTYTSTDYGNSLEEYVNFKDCWSNTYLPLTELSLDEMATALYVGYEVEEDKFKVGDWVTPRVSGRDLSTENDIKVAQIVGVDGYYEINDCGGIFTHDYLRLATPNEVFWAKLGRKTNELRYGDVIVSGLSCLYRITEEAEFADETTMEDAGHRLGRGTISKIFPVESELKMPAKE